MSTKILEPKVVRLKKVKDRFIDVKGDLKFAKSLITQNGEVLPSPQNILLIGPPGTGKSLLVHTLVNDLSEELGFPVPYQTLDCSEDTREYHLKGMYIMTGDETPFVLGALSSAIKIANETGVCVLNLEEISALTQGAQKMLNGVLDWKKSVAIPEANTIVTLDPDAALIICASMNPAGYGGVNCLNADLKSRFGGKLILDFPRMKNEHMILRTLTGADDLLINALIKVAQLTRAKAMDYQISTRDLRNTIESFQVSGDLEKSLFSLAVNYEDDQLSTIVNRIEACFDIDMKKMTEKEAFQENVKHKYSAK